MRVSMVMTAYNATWCIARALDSVMAQTLRPVEVLVCDDGSTDGTPEFVEERYGSDVRVLRLPHRNASATRSIGLSEAQGDWLAFMDADDLWLPEKLQRQAEMAERHPEVRWMGTDGVYFSDEGVIRESWFSDYFDPVQTMVGDLMPPLIERCFTLMSSMLVERNAYHDVGGINPEIVYSHDYDLWMRLAARYPGAMLAEPLIRYYSGPTTLSRRYEARHRDDLQIMRRVASGEFAAPAPLRDLAADRAAALEFEIGLLCLRSGRIREGRLRMWRSSGRGPLGRRAAALAGAAVPRWTMRRLMRSTWVKSRLGSVRRTPPTMSGQIEGRAT